jgi:hypothetical protein
MIKKDAKKNVVLPAIDSFVSQTFDLNGAYGRDAIADQIKQDINTACVQMYVDKKRTHLGGSLIGAECARMIWYRFRWMIYENLHGRVARLFERGHREEDRIIEWLNAIGFNVQQVDDNGNQFRIVDLEGHFGGSCDGIQSSLPERYGIHTNRLLLEFKTANKEGFQKMINLGVVKANEQYWAQQCTYGFKFGIQHCLFICVGKNDDDISVEILELDWDLGRQMLEKAEYIINQKHPPAKISNDPSFWKCKMCPAHKICHLGEPIERNCRSCQFAEPAENKQWQCNVYNQIIPVDFIEQGCAQWKGLPQ